MSRETRKRGQLLYSPTDMNAAFKKEFQALGWKQERRNFWVTSDERLMRRIHGLAPEEQRKEIENAGHTAIGSYNQTDFVKDRVAVEVQFGKYAFVAHDLFVKHLHFYVSDAIDVGVEILPMKELEQEMSSGVPYYERDLVNVLRQGRGGSCRASGPHRGAPMKTNIPRILTIHPKNNSRQTPPLDTTYPNVYPNTSQGINARFITSPERQDSSIDGQPRQFPNRSRFRWQFVAIRPTYSPTVPHWVTGTVRARVYMGVTKSPEPRNYRSNSCVPPGRMLTTMHRNPASRQPPLILSLSKDKPKGASPPERRQQ